MRKGRLGRGVRSPFAILKCKAFSLGEMLVVLGIVGVLFVILQPVGKRVLAAGRGVNCVNQLRQIGVMTQQYVSEHNNKLLLLQTGNGERTWARLFKDEGYAKDYDHLRCFAVPVPSSKKENAYIAMGRRHLGEIDFDEGNGLVLRGETLLSRSSTVELVKGVEKTITSTWLHWLQIPKHSEYILYADAIFSSGGHERLQSYKFHFDGASKESGVQTRHGGRANIAFADGHVEALPPEGLRKAGFVSGYDAEFQAVRW